MKEVIVDMRSPDLNALSVFIQYHAKADKEKVGYTADNKYWYVILLHEWLTNDLGRRKEEVKYLFPLL